MTHSLPHTATPVLKIKDLSVAYTIGHKQTIHAVSDVSFGIDRQETLGLVGESGCGKSTLARAIMQLPPPTSGHVFLADHDLTTMNGATLRAVRPRMQMVFQDPVSSLNPGRRVLRSIAVPLRIMGIKKKKGLISWAREMMGAVGLPPGQYADQYPGQLSGGQCQRVSIARALITQPDVLICDEPVSALDVSVQAQILNLLNRVKVDFGLAMLFISHDLAVVKRIADRVAVMYLGRICELAPTEALFSRQAHPYTSALINSIPRMIQRNSRLPEIQVQCDYPTAVKPSAGCRFHPRCPRMRSLCAEQPPPMSKVANEHYVACHFPLFKDLFK